MELGDLPFGNTVSVGFAAVAILAIMELGDLRCGGRFPVVECNSRNPRYNGIG